MKMNYISKIQANTKQYKTIYTDKMAGNVLDGSYKSTFKGRSMNFDELREYVPGDDIKDMDWKASARSNKLLVRQYIAERKHNIMFLMDSNKRMLGECSEGMEKRELAIMAAGTLAVMVNRNGDFMSSTFAKGESLTVLPFRAGLENVEYFLESYHKAVSMDNETNLNAAMELILRTFNRRMIVVLTTDLLGIQSLNDKLIKQMLVAHDVLVLCVSDADVNGKDDYDIMKSEYLPAFLAEDKKLARIAAQRKEVLTSECGKKLKSHGIAWTIMNNLEECDVKIMEMLSNHKIEKMNNKK